MPSNSNWPGNHDLSSQNQTLRFARQARKVSPALPLRTAVAPSSSSSPRIGWPLALLLGLCFWVAFFWGGTWLLRFFRSFF